MQGAQQQVRNAVTAWVNTLQCPLSALHLLQVKQAVLLSATEAAEMILRVDDIIKCAPRQRSEM